MDGAIMPPGDQERFAVETGLQDGVPLLLKTVTNQCPDRLIVVHEQNSLHARVDLSREVTHRNRLYRDTGSRERGSRRLDCGVSRACRLRSRTPESRV